MKMKKHSIILAVAGLMACVPSMHAAVIGFEGIGGADETRWHQFHNGSPGNPGLGIADTYSGYAWGFGDAPGKGNAIFNADNTERGWAISHRENANSGGWPAPNGVSGNYYAANANGSISLWIDFREAVTFLGGDFSWLSPSGSQNSALNASTIQLFGYADAGTGIGDELHSSGVMALDDTLTTLSVNFTDVRYLEIRSDRGNSWFAVDNLQVGASAVPEPSGALGLGLFLAAPLCFRHRRGFRRSSSSS